MHELSAAQHRVSSATRLPRAIARRSRCGKHVHVPIVYNNLSSARVLTMSFERGVAINDSEGIHALGVSKQKLSQLIAAAFGELVFTFGFVHCALPPNTRTPLT